jgi:hypothetical protein
MDAMRMLVRRRRWLAISEALGGLKKEKKIIRIIYSTLERDGV